MQTFLPYPSFEQSARVLDNRRLGKQRVECLQILQALACGPYQKCENSLPWTHKTWVKCQKEEFQTKRQIHTKYRNTPWYNHPAVKMWRGYELALANYGFSICDAWIQRGFKDTCLGKITQQFDLRLAFMCPPWLGNEAFHASHRSNLLRKDPTWYSQFGWTEPNDLPYVWPVDK